QRGVEEIFLHSFEKPRENMNIFSTLVCLTFVVGKLKHCTPSLDEMSEINSSCSGSNYV
ncbi:MAG: hypothetical protein MHPSP_004450, partial [Paramarteilia canceri]